MFPKPPPRVQWILRPRSRSRRAAPYAKLATLCRATDYGRGSPGAGLARA